MRCRNLIAAIALLAIAASLCFMPGTASDDSDGASSEDYGTFNPGPSGLPASQFRYWTETGGAYSKVEMTAKALYTHRWSADQQIPVFQASDISITGISDSDGQFTISTARGAGLASKVSAGSLNGQIGGTDGTVFYVSCVARPTGATQPEEFSSAFKVVERSDATVVPVIGLHINAAKTTVEAGESISLSAVVAPSNATDRTVSWSVTEGSSHVSITPSGLGCSVLGVSAGKAVIRCEANDGSGKYDTKTVTVTETEPPQSDLKIEPATASVKANGSVKFTASGGTGEYEWSVSPAGPRLSDGGQGDEVRFVVPNQPGTYTITVKSGGATATATLTGTAAVYVYYLTFDANGGTGGPSEMEERSQDKTHTFTIPAIVPSNPGSTFKGWAETPDGNAVVQPGGSYKFKYEVEGDDAIDGERTLYAVWEKITAKLSFDANGGEGAPPPKTTTSSTSEGEFLFLIPTETPTKPGSVFKGWAKTPSGSAEYQPGRIIITGDPETVLYAVWGSEAPEETTFSLIFNANGGSGEPPSMRGRSSTGSCEFVVPEAKPSKPGFVFGGWSGSSTGPAVVQPGGRYTATETSTTLYAIWLAEGSTTLFTVTYDGGGGESARQSDVVPEGTRIALPDATRDGYRLIGWFDGVKRVGGPGDGYAVNGNATLKAEWASENPADYVWAIPVLMMIVLMLLAGYTGNIWLGIPATLAGLLAALMLLGVV